MKNDIQIAQEAKMEPIVKIAEKIGLNEDDIELYGKYKCKISLEALDKNKDEKDGKLVISTGEFSKVTEDYMRQLNGNSVTNEEDKKSGFRL